MTTSVIATRGLKPAEFSVGEHVLCFEPDPTKARVLYDSKILELEWTKDEVTNRRVPEYLVHFNGWNSSWDRWAPANYILRYTDENLELKGKLHRQALAKMGKKKKKKTLAELVEQARRRQAGRGSDSEVSSGAADSDDSDDSSSSEETEAVEIPIPLPDALKTKLEDDCYFISCKSKLVKLPCKPTILSIMEDYIRHFAINVQLHEKKRIQTQSAVAAAGKEGLVPPPLPKYNVDLCKEVMDGLRIIFDFILPTNLLYGQEKVQFRRVVSSCYVPNMAPVVPKPNKRGRPRKHSVPAASAPARPAEPTPAPKEEDEPKKKKEEPKTGPPEEDPPRRVTRRLSTSGQIALAAPLPLVKRRCTDADHHGKPGPHAKRHTAVDAVAGSQARDPPAPPPKPVLRHSTRLASSSFAPATPVSETPQQPPPPPATTSLTPVAPLNRSESTESSQSSSVGSGKASSTGKNSSKGVGAGDNGLDPKRLPSCKLLADDANYNGKMPLCKIYGAQHLMRLFVKLPELLGKMDLPPKKLRPLLKHIELFLKYLGHADRIEDFFPESAYTNGQDALQPVKTT